MIHMIYDGNTTVDDVLGVWDKGGAIWSVEMGGLGPGYEQAIQILIVELLRDQRGKPLPTNRDDMGSWGDETAARIDKQCHGLSGAQVGAAKQVAFRILRDGYAATLTSMKEFDPDRLIQVSNTWPTVSA